MTKVLSTLLNTYTIYVQVLTTPGEQGFRLVAPGLLGKEYVTSPALTARILASPDFDQLFGAQQAQRIMALVLERATQLAADAPANP